MLSMYWYNVRRFYLTLQKYILLASEILCIFESAGVIAILFKNHCFINLYFNNMLRKKLQNKFRYYLKNMLKSDGFQLLYFANNYAIKYTTIDLYKKILYWLLFSAYVTTIEYSVVICNKVFVEVFIGENLDTALPFSRTLITKF